MTDKDGYFIVKKDRSIEMFAFVLVSVAVVITYLYQSEMLECLNRGFGL